MRLLSETPTPRITRRTWSFPPSSLRPEDRSTTSERLRLKLELVVPALALPGRILLEHPRARELFPPYLAIGYHIARAGIPLMETALSRAQELAGDDPVADGLIAYLARHIPEELHGGEPGGGIRDDLEALGVDVSTLRTQLPPPKVATLIGAQYYWILHYHPVALLGFLQLEAFHAEIPTLELLIERTGLPPDGFRQLLLHAELDIAHARELHRVLDSLPLEPWHERLITTSALQTIASVVDLLLDVVGDKGTSAV